MPINPIVLQRRHAELGRIRLGDQQATNNGGTRPNKLDRFRFTSVSQRYITDLAALYGGEAKAWDNNGIASWEVYSTAQVIPVIAVKGGLTQWMEFWSGGGCIHRCDGVTSQLTGEACDLNEQVRVGRKMVNPHTEARPTTRLSVMLPELEAIGVWRMESHGWNSAAEIPAVAELATFVGDLVPAHLHLVERRAIKDGKTSRFVVPVLDLQIGTARLKQIVEAKISGGELPPAARAQVEGRAAAQLEGGSAVADAFAPYDERLAAATTRDDLMALWHDAVEAELVGTRSQPSEARTEFCNRFQAKSQSMVAQQQPDDDGVVDGVVVDDADAVWQRCLAAGGRAGLSLDDVTEEYARFSGGEAASVATAAQLESFIVELDAMAQAVSA